jgi:purine-binding chemotaxis protein CheW
MIHLVTFTLDEHRYALRLSAVERILRAVEAEPLPQAPEIVLGVINLQGRILPVVNIRKRFHLAGREVGLTDHLIIAHTSKRAVALIADSVTGVSELPEQEVIASDEILPGLEYVEGVVRLQDGVLFIHDLDRFLSLEEERSLEAALERS